MPVVVDSLDFTFLDAVNRVLRTNGIIKGDDDNVTTFNDVQHNATLNLAQIAIQDELNDLVSDRLIPLERGTDSILTVSGTRAYALADDFVQFYGKPLLYNSSQNRQIFEYPGGEEVLRLQIFDYKTSSGNPNWWYLEDAGSKQIALYQVPGSADAGQTWTYDYEKDTSVTNSTDEMPFHNNMEAQAFCAMASRRFKFLFENAQNTELVLAQDPSYQSAKSRLVRLMKGKNPYQSYGFHYA